MQSVFIFFNNQITPNLHNLNLIYKIENSDQYSIQIQNHFHPNSFSDFVHRRMHKFESDLFTTVDSILHILGQKPKVTREGQDLLTLSPSNRGDKAAGLKTKQGNKLYAYASLVGDQADMSLKT